MPMTAPTTADVLGWTQLDALRAADPATADRLVAVAISMLKRFTGIDFATVSDDDVPVVQYAITGLAELLTYQSSPDYMETLADFDLLQSFNAGNYSETRRDPKAAREARLLVAWPWLSDMLWGLMSPDRYDYWYGLFSTTPPPAFDVQEVDWSAGTDLYGSYGPDPWYGSGGF